jgi:zinc D-Ala-D-Ala carboxypeptidase
MKISKYFELDELLITGVHKYITKNMEIGRNDPQVVKKLTVLATTILDPIREHFGKPMIINSGYRFPDLNKAVGGSPTSQHMLAEAADTTISEVSLKDYFDFVRKSNLPYGQIIYEFDAWIHISLGAGYRDLSRCRENIVAFKDGRGKTVYKHVSDGVSPVGYRG